MRILMKYNVNFLCVYFLLKIVVRPKHVADNLNKIVKKLFKQCCVRQKPFNLI
jgi:hypothetical protein